uniref:Carn_acyltransf domain-containing protein n=1 Tax=Panagrellus redivivus TaxID=6233 RepID=A0A7E4VWJ5_PANRE
MLHQRQRWSVCALRLFDLSRHQALAGCAITQTMPYSKLPKLMPPDLDNTLKTFLEFAQPLQTYQDFEKTKKLTQEFVKSGEAQTLHELLVDRAEKLNNWLTPWWLNIAYLQARTPLPIITSPGVAFPPLEYSGEEGQIATAAKMIQAALNYHHKIISDHLPEDKAGKVPFDMSQYKFLFGTTRVPKLVQDEIVYGASKPKFAQHILVTRNGHTFYFPVYDQNDIVLGTDVLEGLIRDYVIPNSQTRVSHPVNLVSSDDRDTWAKLYEKLKKRNPQEIQAYEDALFILSLDSQVPVNPDRNRYEEQMRQQLTGGGADENGINRWFDKTLQFNIGFDGYSGLTYEHTPAEGPPVANLMDNVCSRFESNTFVKESSNEPVDVPRELKFNVDQSDEDVIAGSAAALNRAAFDLEVRFLSFREFGKNVPKKAKLSPDSFIQMAFQVAHYRLHHILPPTYETATLRKFSEGRTDTIRLPNPVSALFTKTFVDNRENQSAKELAKLFRDAVTSHKNYSVRAMLGQGIDRHLLGLRLIASEKGIDAPKLFSGDAYRKMTHFRVSTSQVPTRFVIPMGFGPSAPDCYGICYNPQEDAIHFTLSAFNSCKETSAKKFAAELERVLNDFKTLLEDSGDLSNAKL